MARDLRALDGEHPRLEHLAAALVGSSHTSLYLQEMRASMGGARRSQEVPALRRSSNRAGSRCARHMVLLVAVAIRAVRLAGRHAGPPAFLSRAHTRHGPRDSFFLGSQDAHGGLPLHGPAGVPPKPLIPPAPTAHVESPN